MGYSRIKLAGPKMTYYVTFSTYYVTCKITDGLLQLLHPVILCCSCTKRSNLLEFVSLCQITEFSGAVLQMFWWVADRESWDRFTKCCGFVPSLLLLRGIRRRFLYGTIWVWVYMWRKRCHTNYINMRLGSWSESWPWTQIERAKDMATRSVKPIT